MTDHHDAGLRARVLECLDTVADPCSVASGDALGLREMGLIDSVKVAEDGAVVVDLRLTAPSCLMIGYFATEIERVVTDVPGVTHVQVVHDTGDRWSPELMSDEVQERRRARFRQLELEVLGSNSRSG